MFSPPLFVTCSCFRLYIRRVREFDGHSERTVAIHARVERQEETQAYNCYLGLFFQTLFLHTCADSGECKKHTHVVVSGKGLCRGIGKALQSQSRWEAAAENFKLALSQP